jgi:hypothetical protein
VRTQSDEIWPPLTPSKQVVCIFCNGLLCYAKSSKVSVVGQITELTHKVLIDYTLVCASCQRTFQYQEKRDVVEVADG